MNKYDVLRRFKSHLLIAISKRLSRHTENNFHGHLQVWMFNPYSGKTESLVKELAKTFELKSRGNSLILEYDQCDENNILNNITSYLNELNRNCVDRDRYHLTTTHDLENQESKNNFLVIKMILNNAPEVLIDVDLFDEYIKHNAGRINKSRKYPNEGHDNIINVRIIQLLFQLLLEDGKGSTDNDYLKLDLYKIQKLAENGLNINFKPNGLEYKYCETLEQLNLSGEDKFDIYNLILSSASKSRLEKTVKNTEKCIEKVKKI